MLAFQPIINNIKIINKKILLYLCFQIELNHGEKS